MPSVTTLTLLSVCALVAAAFFYAWASRRARRAAMAGAEPSPGPVEESASAFRLLSDCSSDLVLLVDAAGKVAYGSPSAERTFGIRLEVMRGEPFVSRILGEDRPRAEEMLAAARRDGTARATLRATLPNGELRAFDTLVDSSRGGQHGMLAVSGRDVTDQERLAAQLRQSQKLEAMGRLAAGVAHDFNNLLTVIRSGTTLARECLPAGHPAHADLADVAAAADRGVAITRQILAFTRREGAGSHRANLSTVLAEMARFVPRLMGRGIQVKFAEGPALGDVPLSETSLEQVILNLAINARDAMPSGGWITVESRRVEVRGGDGSGLPAGSHVEIAVRDQGIGMSEEVQRHLFEPFFTTKGPGLGSGLGLATSRGIVAAVGGTIEVETEVGRGSVIRVILPRLPGAAGAVLPGKPPTVHRSRVLLVDHDPAMVALLSRLLAARGHEVIAAASAMEARLQAASFPGAVDVLVTGFDLGDDHGVKVLGEVRRTSPRVRAVLLAGGIRDASDLDHLLEAGVELVRRPVSPEALVEVVERATARAPLQRDPAMA